MGLAIVTTDVRGCREVVEDGLNGILVPKGDAERLAEALRTLGDDADLRRRMGIAGRKVAGARFSEAGVVETVMRTYSRLLAS